MRTNLESMKKFYSCLLLVFTASSLFAQPASDEFPNWTHTDIEGVEHTLYDYLDDGKIVLIDIFTTWCPNCVNSLPALHDIEAAHGIEGDNTVVIFSFERDPSTTNEAEWATNNGVTSPIFADALATMETWNTFYQPNYFVICPDRTHSLVVGAVNSDPTELLDLIDSCGNATSILENDPLSVELTSTLVNENLSFYSTDVLAQYRILNLNGQAVLEGKTGQRADVNTSALAPGIYLLQVQNSSEVLTRKFVKH